MNDNDYNNQRYESCANTPTPTQPLLSRVSKLEAQFSEFVKRAAFERDTLARRVNELEGTLGVVRGPEPAYDGNIGGVVPGNALAYGGRA